MEETAATTSETTEGAVLYTHRGELGVTTGLLNVEVKDGEFKFESVVHGHSWTDSAGTQRKASHEVFQGNEHDTQSSLLFGLFHTQVDVRSGHVEGVTKSSSAFNQTRDGARTGSTHRESTAYEGGGVALNGTTQAEHLHLHKDVLDHQETVNGKDKTATEIHSAFDGQRDSNSSSGTWHSAESIHHESGHGGRTSDVMIQRIQPGDEHGPARGGACDAMGKMEDGAGPASSCETFKLHPQ